MAKLQVIFVLMLVFYTGLIIGQSGNVPESLIRKDETGAVELSSSNGSRNFGVGDFEFIFFSERMETWTDALHLCYELAPGSHLAALNRSKFTEDVAHILADHPELLKQSPYIWIDGIYEGGRWLWAETDEFIPCKRKTGGYPPWALDHHPDDKECLSIEMGSGKNVNRRLFFRSHRCEEKNGFLCLRARNGNHGVKVEPTAHTSVNQRTTARTRDVVGAIVAAKGKIVDYVKNKSII